PSRGWLVDHHFSGNRPPAGVRVESVIRLNGFPAKRKRKPSGLSLEHIKRRHPSVTKTVRGTKIGFFHLSLEVCSTVKIINLKVPSTYLLDQTSKTPDPLILDCEYEVDENEKGFVLKWLLDNQPVYQWIPSKNPFPFQSFKNRVDTSYVVSQEHMHKHRAMAIIKPLANFTGEYMCTVQTYSGIDRKSAKLKIIVRESKFDLSYYLNGDGYITVDCHARDISPLPKLQIRINDELFTTDNLKSVRGENGLYNASISGRIRKDQLESPATIECLLSIPETNYNKRRSTTYYGFNSTVKLDYVRSFVGGGNGRWDPASAGDSRI
ncbi:uncharacterized protein LOC125953795, partial [Anopheles darlingi]|uniref:uncharacterized protein LOC125953795 n=1 Tax=Anopheles darlingi TaxID=43151 RepID=UPI0021003E6E